MALAVAASLRGSSAFCSSEHMTDSYTDTFDSNSCIAAAASCQPPTRQSSPARPSNRPHPNLAPQLSTSPTPHPFLPPTQSPLPLPSPHLQLRPPLPTPKAPASQHRPPSPLVRPPDLPRRVHHIPSPPSPADLLNCTRPAARPCPRHRLEGLRGSGSRRWARLLVLALAVAAGMAERGRRAPVPGRTAEQDWG